MGPPYRARRSMPGLGPGPGSLPAESLPAEGLPAESLPAESLPADGPPELASRSAGTGPGGRAIATLSGVRHPIVAILLLISFFTAISGKPIDGLLMLTVAVGLAWDGATQLAGGTGSPGARPVAVRPARARLAAGAPARAARPAGPERAGDATTTRRRSAAVVAWIACGAVYAVVVGAFTRYSWPVTVAVISLGAAVVLVGWQGPVRDRPVPASAPLAGTGWWGGLLVAAGLWELSALFQQPSLTADSHAHPTISSLADPLLGSHPGRSLALAIWLGLGWLVVRQ